MLFLIWYTSMTANTTCSSPAAVTSWSKDGISHQMFHYWRNNLKIRMKRCSISFKLKYIQWPGIMLIRYSIVVGKLLKFMNGWLKLTLKDNYLIWMDIRKWFLQWLWCRNCSFLQLVAMTASSFFGTPFHRQRNLNIKNILAQFPAWLSIKD